MQRKSTCTQEGMVASQPGVCVSVTTASDRTYAVLNVSRMYPDLPNEWGGKGVFKHCDCDGMRFPNSEAAFAYALERGYCRLWFKSPEHRAQSKEWGAARWAAKNK